MILVAGGQLDPSIGRLLRRILARKLPFRDLITGRGLLPSLEIVPGAPGLRLNGEDLHPQAVFARHDVFWAERHPGTGAHTAALNWYYAIRGWALGQPGVRLFNRHASGSENNKLANLALAADAGLDTPETRILSDPHDDALPPGWIQKPVAGGELTTTLADLRDNIAAAQPGHATAYPRFFQERLNRPELRVFGAGGGLMGFRLTSDDLDYRMHQNVQLSPEPVPDDIAGPLLSLADTLRLDFFAADFMRRDDGGLVFLEINTNPMFAAFDRAAGGALCDLMLDSLLAAEGAGAARRSS